MRISTPCLTMPSEMAHTLFCILILQLLVAHGLYLNEISKNHESNNPEKCDVICERIEPMRNNSFCNCNSTRTESDVLKIKRETDDEDDEDEDEEPLKNKFKLDFSKFRLDNQNEDKLGFVERIRERLDQLKEARENAVDQKPALVERFYEKVEQLKDLGKASEPVLGQINPSLMNFSPQSTGIGGIPPIVAPGFNPLIPPNPYSYPHNQYYNNFDPLYRFHPYRRVDPILVAPVSRAAAPKPILHALRDHVDNLISGLDKHHHPPGLLNSDAMSNSESQVNQINVNVRLDGSSTPHSLFAHLLPFLGAAGLGGLAGPLPLLLASNPDNITDESFTPDPIGNGLTTTERLENPLTGPPIYDLVTEEPRKEVKETTKKYNIGKKKFKIIKGRFSENVGNEGNRGELSDGKEEVRKAIEDITVKVEGTTVKVGNSKVNEVTSEIVNSVANEG